MSIKWGMKLLIHSPNFNNAAVELWEWKSNFHIWVGMWLLSHAWIEVNPCLRAPGRWRSNRVHPEPIPVVCPIYHYSDGSYGVSNLHDDVIKWKHFPRYWPFVQGNSPVTGEFPSQRPVTRSFDVFFHLCLNKRLSKQLRGWWFKTPSRSLGRHCNATPRMVFFWGFSNVSSD